MSISFVHLRRVVFGTSCAVVFGFGATQALALPVQAASSGTCYFYQEAECQRYCAETWQMSGSCVRTSLHYSCSCYLGPYMPNDP